MKKLIMGMLAVALAVGGMAAGATSGPFIPTVGQLFGVTSAGAASLSVEASTALAPLTPTGLGFTYQGRLKDGTNPANGQYDFQFTLYDALTGGTLVGGPVSQANQTVSEGLFSVLLDFGASAFNGDARYLAITVQPSGGGGYTTLSPRQAITPAPYALYALKTKGYKNVVTVAQEGGDFTAVQAALTSITANSASNKYLIWVGPGTYTEQVTMKPWVDIEGSGELTTKITFAGNPNPNTGTVVGASNAELRSLTVENTGGDARATAIYNNAASPSLLHVTATAAGGIASSIGVFNDNAAPTMNNVTATASGGTNSTGIHNISSAPRMSNVTAVASGGTYSSGMQNISSSPNMTGVTLAASGGSTSNTGLYNANSAPIMNNVTATASGDNENYGVINVASSPTMNNVTVTASGGASLNYGVYENTSSAPTMNNVTITASGGNDSYGVYNANSAPSLTNVTVTASAGIRNYGVVSGGAGTTTINNSAITGSTNALSSGPGVTTQVGASRLSGGPVVGPVTCVASYDGNNKRLGTLCTPDSKMVYVATTGGDFTAITAALNSITDSSATNKYLVRVGPGTYTEQVTMKQYVDIEGSGELTTRITFTGSPSPNTGTVVGANNAELRSLTVANTGGDHSAIAIYNVGASPSLWHVTAIASGGAAYNFGVYNYQSAPSMNNVTATASGADGSDNLGVYNDNSSSPSMNNVTATASGSTESHNWGVYNDNSSPSLTNVTATASGGSFSAGVDNLHSSSPTINNSNITGSNSTVRANGATAKVGASKLNGGPVSGGVTCAGVYDENYAFFASTCP